MAHRRGHAAAPRSDQLRGHSRSERRLRRFGANPEITRVTRATSCTSEKSGAVPQGESHGLGNAIRNDECSLTISLLQRLARGIFRGSAATADHLLREVEAGAVRMAIAGGGVPQPGRAGG